jgi:ATP-dependent DNA helicase RecG
MLTPEEARLLVAKPESERIERKRAFSNAESVREAICAFANDMQRSGESGFVLLGVEDGGMLARLPITDDLLLRLSALRDEGNILPLPRMEVYRVEVEPGVEIAVVEVHPSDGTPVRLRGRTYIRVGPRNTIASLEEERILTERQRLNSLTFDRKPCLGPATVDDLRLDFFREEYLPRMIAKEVLEHDTRPVEHQLAALRLWASWMNKPTSGGLLLIAKQPREWLDGLWMQFVRFDGPDRSYKVISDAKYEGGVFDQIKALEQIPKNIRSVRTASGEEVPDYPEEAIRELVINAILHRAYDVGNAPSLFYFYSDHVEVLNPGGLHAPVTPATFGFATAYRNEVLAEAMKAFGYVHKFGSGIPTVHRTLKANGNPPAEFYLGAGSFGVNLFPRKGGT